MTAQSFALFSVGEGPLPEPAFEQDIKYIQSKLGGKRFASRADIVPSEIKSILPEVAVFAPIFNDDGAVVDLEIRIEGTLLSRFYGEHTGQKIGDGFNERVKGRIIAAASKAIEIEAPVCAELVLRSPSERTVTVRSLYIPLSENNDVIDNFFVHFRIQYDSIK
ncbi:MAG: PAS domain-containing protein [Kordiimonas sp.]